MQPIPQEDNKMYESNWLARRLETPVCGWRLYSWLLLLLATSLVGTSVGFGIYADRTRKLSECAELPIRAKGDYDPTQHCLTWSESVGIQAMPDGICPNSCDQHLYDTHLHIRSNQLKSSSMTPNAKQESFCEAVCNIQIQEGQVLKITNTTCAETCFRNKDWCQGDCAVCGEYETDGTTCVTGHWSCKTPHSTECSTAIQLGKDYYQVSPAVYDSPCVVVVIALSTANGWG